MSTWSRSRRSRQVVSAAMSPVLVTGATGFMGRALVARLLAEGRAVRVLERRPSDAFDGLAVERVTGDVTQPETLPAACAGAETVFNLAGVLSYDAKDEARLQAVNVDGLAHVLAAVRQAGRRARRPGLERRRGRLHRGSGAAAERGLAVPGGRLAQPLLPHQAAGRGAGAARRCRRAGRRHRVSRASCSAPATSTASTRSSSRSTCAVSCARRSRAGSPRSTCAMSRRG